MNIVWGTWLDSSSVSVDGIDVSFSSEASHFLYQEDTNFWSDPRPNRNGEGFYWNGDTAYISNSPPPNSDVLFLNDLSLGQKQTLSFSESVLNPVMAIMSLGQKKVGVKYEFDTPFELVSTGRGYFGGSEVKLNQPGKTVLFGGEGNGLIRFDGVHDSISWITTTTKPDRRETHGFTIGIPSPVPESSLPTILIAGVVLLSIARRLR